MKKDSTFTIEIKLIDNRTGKEYANGTKVSRRMLADLGSEEAGKYILRKIDILEKGLLNRLAKILEEENETD